jgi:hypothetical protein
MAGRQAVSKKESRSVENSLTRLDSYQFIHQKPSGLVLYELWMLLSAVRVFSPFNFYYYQCHQRGGRLRLLAPRGFTRECVQCRASAQAVCCVVCVCVCVFALRREM